MKALGWHNDRHSGDFVAVFIDCTNLEPLVLIPVLSQLACDSGRVKSRRLRVGQHGACFVLEGH